MKKLKNRESAIANCQVVDILFFHFLILSLFSFIYYFKKTVLLDDPELKGIIIYRSGI
jgi:hypothetical protein